MLKPETPPVKARSGRALRRVARYILLGLALPLVVVAAIAGAAFGVIEYDGNVHAVKAGTVYRSAQLGPDQLVSVIHERGIKTVLNLRGDNTGSDWYDDEIRVSTKEGVQHIDFRMSANHELSGTQMVALVKLMRDAPKPLLLHCKSGADRSGLASALYVLDSTQDADAAGDQLALRYGHFPYLGSKTVAMNNSFRRYADARDKAASAP
jgi:protein tyrosine phosphatase (PTP) superfamily phosphohydrolase (DUF442 family)